MNQGQYRNRASFGKRQEFIAIAELLRRGFDVYNTLVDDQQIDCVIRCGDRHYVDVQIKAKSMDNCQPRNAGTFAPLKIPNPRDSYFFLFYVELIDTYWILPSTELAEQAYQNRHGPNEGMYSINITSCRGGEVRPSERFSRYVDRFDLLCCRNTP